ncbi:MAG: DUF1553 domain-containing protein [Pirellulaceae bacterium]|nr:DUF1553 domain-containing protein [Pirellulaceae bacterium]
MADVDQADRLSLADWLVAPNHPLTARVAVNRVWQQLWGLGFVDSPENFGTQCGRPEHTVLLDWLATEYVRLEWDTKALIKTIVTSATFRQSSSASESAWKMDPSNRRLARGPRFRLPIHVLRDQALVLGGLLKSEVGGPPVLLEPQSELKGEKPTNAMKIDTHRRTLYTFWKRNGPHPMLASFDVADRNQCDLRVRRTNTPLQALVTLNSSDFEEATQGLAGRILDHASDDATRLRFAFRSTVGTIPFEEELEVLQQALANYRVSRVKESNLIDAEQAAWLALANMLLNVDATLTLE